MVFSQIISQSVSHPADHTPRAMRKTGRLFGEKLDFEDIKFLDKTKDIRKIEKENFINISVFGYGKR